MRLIALLLMACALISGCAAGPHLHAGNAIFNLGQSLPPEMVDRHLAGYVGFDEDFVDRYNRVAKNVLYVQGIVKGTPEYQLRIARMNISNPGSALWVDSGELTVMTGAVIPDQLPRLKAGDIVEIRQTGTYRTMENFLQKKEGNIVTRIICRKADADYENCLNTKAPRIGKVKGVGETGTPYPASVADYGFTFTPAYTPDGKPLNKN